MADKNAVMYLLHFMHENTDELHPVDIPTLRENLQKNGFVSDPRTIRKDLDLLIESGYDIVYDERPGSGARTKYFYGTRELERSELRILIDAVSSAQFITRNKTRELIKKLTGLARKYERKGLAPTVYVAENIKAENPQILVTLEEIAQAIRMKKKISFKYYNYNLEKKRIYRHNEEVYVLSPYATIWQDDRYYVVGWSDKRQDVIPFRIDRMQKPVILEEDAVPAPEAFSIQDYADKFTNMYGGKIETVTLRCRNDLVDAIIDKFGKDVEFRNITAESFEVNVEVAVGGTFLSWLFRFAGGIEIEGPENVREFYAEMLTTASRDQRLRKLSGKPGSGWKLK